MTNSDDRLVLVEHDGYAAILTLNRPAKKNAMSDALLAQLIAAIRTANADDAVRAIIISGAGSCFTAGRDISQFDQKAILQDGSVDRTVDIFLEALTLLMESPKPTIAAIHGLALGGGQAMSLACDFVVAEAGAKFGNVEMAYGFPAAMNIALLTRQVGRRIGLEIAMTGNLYTAEQYHGFGLVNRLAGAGRLMETALEFAGALTDKAPWAVRRTKSTYRLAEDMPVQGAMNFGNQLNQLLMLNSQIETIHSGDSRTKDAIQGKISKKD
ncbi:MAG: enoyl-CoA hydratase/isomerase family protein [Proteobacteria bacterium]|nr:enoyl-CoA hydratase/isomerase family protein [Pseudomonadota bacterium]